jgi:hypothetical protein
MQLVQKLKHVQFLVILWISLKAVRIVRSEDVKRLLSTYNTELRYFNHLGADVAWNFSTNFDQAKDLLGKTYAYLLLLP